MIPGFIIALLTFPGVIVHELAHQFFCRLLKVPVFKVCYIRVGNPSGYVIHEHPHSPWKSLLIGYGPLLVNSIVGTLIAFPAVLALVYLNNGWWLDGLLIYLGFHRHALVSQHRRCRLDLESHHGPGQLHSRQDRRRPARRYHLGRCGRFRLLARRHLRWLPRWLRARPHRQAARRALIGRVSLRPDPD